MSRTSQTSTHIRAANRLGCSSYSKSSYRPHGTGTALRPSRSSSTHTLTAFRPVQVSFNSTVFPIDEDDDVNVVVENGVLTLPCSPSTESRRRFVAIIARIIPQNSNTASFLRQKIIRTGTCLFFSRCGHLSTTGIGPIINQVSGRRRGNHGLNNASASRPIPSRTNSVFAKTLSYLQCARAILCLP